MWERDSRPGLRVFLAVCALVIVVSQVGCRATAGQESSDGWLVPDEPRAAAAFVASQRDRDEVAASRVVSPLFRAEMERRGRGDEWPLAGLWTEATSVLDFRFVGAVADRLGFTFALYTARPRHSVGPDSPTSLWRLDLDPDGRVIWADLARILSSPDVVVVKSPANGGESGVSTPPWFAFRGHDQPQSVFGVRSSAGDAYLAVEVGTRGAHDDRSGRLTFVMLNASGEVLPNCWSFGQPVPTWDAQWHPVDPRAFDQSHMDSADLRTLEFYLMSIDSGPTEG